MKTLDANTLPVREPQPAAAPAVVNNAAAPAPAAPPSQALVPAAAPGGHALGPLADSFGEALATLDDLGVGRAGALLNLNDADKQLGGTLPQIKIMQPTSREAGKLAPAGAWYHSISGDSAETLTLSVIAAKWGRQFLDAYVGGEGLRVICAASDGLARDLPDDRSSAPDKAPAFGTPCLECPHRDVKGECGDLYTLLVYVHEWEQPALWFVRSTAIKAWRRANTMIKAYGGREWQRRGLPGQPQPNLVTQFTVGSEEGDAKKGRYFVPTSAGFAPIADEAVQTAVLQALGLFGKSFVETSSDELEKASEKKGDEFDQAIEAQKAHGSGGFGGPSQDDGDPGPSDGEVDKF